MDIKRIVNCTPEQFEALHRDGQVDVNGEVKTKEDGTLYNPGELPLLEWYNKVMAEELGRNKVAHSPVIVKSLEQYREDIIADPSNEITADTSAVGFSAILKQGDIVPVHTNPWSFIPGDDNVGLCFINGKEAKTTYTHTSEHEELVRVWYFATSQLSIDLTYEPRYCPHEFRIISKDGGIGAVNSFYYEKASEVYVYGNGLIKTLSSADKVTVEGVSTIDQTFKTAREITLSGESTADGWTGIGGNTQLKKAIFPGLKTIGAGGAHTDATQFRGCNNPALEIVFPKLQKISGATHYLAFTFSEVERVILPETVQEIGNNVFGFRVGNIVLNCKTAKSILPNWCSATPLYSFSMCKEWQASINIATAAKGLWDAERMRDFLENYLADLHDYAPEYSGGAGVVIGAELTIPQDVLTTLEENGEDGEVVEENGETRKGCLLIAEEKGWIIGGA